jgi:DNA modification methylase
VLITNPKRANESVDSIPNLYNYYAGYSHLFTKNIIDSSELPKSAIILDPWNGSGTTTLMASMSGYISIGVDLNPVMKIIAKAKQATFKDIELEKEKLSHVNLKSSITIDSGDPLEAWFDQKSVKVLRKFERHILSNIKYKNTNEKVDSLSPAQCIMYTVLFNSIRLCLASFIPSNPTWVKKPKLVKDKVSIKTRVFKEQYQKSLNEMLSIIAPSIHAWPSNINNLIIGTSTNLPIENESVDLIITSPPYCTRIDYGIATSPEISVVAVGGLCEMDLIRRKLMGTTTVPKSVESDAELFSVECKVFLNKVKEHTSKSSKTYYFKNLAQYFLSLKNSIMETSRVLKNGCKFVCVVQDSYYKDVHCNLPKIITEMGASFGLYTINEVEFESKHNMGNVNVNSRKYRKKNTAIETVLILKKRN